MEFMPGGDLSKVLEE